jgi:hypothetical protein
LAHRSKLSPYTYNPGQLGLDGVTLASDRTSNSFDVRYRSEASISVKATRSAYTAVNLKLQHSPNNGTDWFDLQEITVATGADTLEDYNPTKTVSASDNFEARITNLSFKDMRVVVSSTSGGANDTISVWVTVK